MKKRIWATLTNEEWITVRKQALDAGVYTEDYVAELIRFALHAKSKLVA